MSKENQVDEKRAHYERLVAEGRITPATRPLPKVPPVPVTAPVSASDLVLAERDEER
jgi:hypothetical protein